MSDLREKIINGIIEREGGYVDDPDDSGGETRWGITRQVAKRNGWTGDMHYLPRELAYRIYVERYWETLALDDLEKLSPVIAEELADTGVNMGVDRAAEFLQRALNVLNNRGEFYPDLMVDRDVGPRTTQAFTTYLQRRGDAGEAVLLRMLNALQGAFYVELAERRQKDEKFVFGWFKERVS